MPEKCSTHCKTKEIPPHADQEESVSLLRRQNASNCAFETEKNCCRFTAQMLMQQAAAVPDEELR
jgi:hypothetical protein